MKIYLSTFFNNGNLGSELQATSLCAFLKENGYNDIVLIKKKNNSFLRKVFNRVYVNYKKIFLNRDMKKMILVKEIHTKNHCLLSDKTKILIEEYSKNNFRTYCGNNIKKLICKEAIFICGSDQIWSPLIFCNNEFYFLKKVQKSKKIGRAHV